jgi:hypothetical protein
MSRLARVRRFCLYGAPLISAAAVVAVAVRPQGWPWAVALFVLAGVLLAVGDGSGPYGVVPDRPSSK